jgi:hypothetical protein
MGLLKAIFTLVISIVLVNYIYKNKNELKDHTIFRFIIPYTNSMEKSYLIIISMTIIISLL